MAATLHDVALLAGVSIKTVSNVVNDYPHIRPETRARVEAAIAELGYQPNPSARSLRSGRTGLIGLAVPELSLSSYFAELADRMIAAAEQRGLTVLIEQTGGDRQRELDVLRSARRKMTDGLLFSALGMQQDDAELLRQPYPLVLLGERIFGGPTDHVTMHNVEAARTATEHLLRLGRRRIAVVGAHVGEVIGSAGLRLRGYREALEAAGEPYREELIGYAEPWHRADGAEVTRRLIATGEPFDGLFAFNDNLAFGAMRALQEAHIAIPEQVAVLGFDNLDDAAYSVPSLSTVDPGLPEIVETSISLLVERIAGRGPDEPQELMAGYRIVERESTPAR
ncbi:LacI family DNA-binding transcriptional regulator [Pseudolysinimonas sp.]|uniref:LacI family DNA-binding transcriptional regulator n=1 Tax=Pseudolysinimonas sp. TaxID=2680009 RepID=UPI003F8009CD